MKTIPVRQIASAQILQGGSGRFSIRSLQQVLNGKALVHNLHKHDFYFLLAIVEGGGVHEIDFVAYPVDSHSIFILRPGQVHRLELTANTTGFLVEFDLSFYHPKMTIKEQRWKKALSRNYCDVDDETFSSLLNHLSHIFEEQAHKQEGHSEAIRAHLDLFFISYIRQLRNPVSAANPGKDYVRERYEEFAGLLETNITSMKNVSQYAGLMNISSYQLNSITKATVGKTVSALIDEQVILESKRYLLATPNQVKEIADHLGYEDPSYFIRFFKKHTGYSPDTFRKSFK